VDSRLHQTTYQWVKLHGVEVGGIWIENQEATNDFLQKSGIATANKTPIFFLSYHEVILIVGSLDVVALDEKAFGV
jgi:hypothetical protein